MGGTPWHAHHIAERYGLLTIIALGEGVVGTVASLSAVVARRAGRVDAVLVAVAGIGLTFGMWWVYFIVPQSRAAACPSRAVLLVRLPAPRGVRRDRGDRRRAACRRLLHRAPLEARRGRHRAVGGDTGGGLHRWRSICSTLADRADAGRVPPAAARAHRGGAGRRGVCSPTAGMSMANCLLIVMLAPVVTVVGYEAARLPARRGGHRSAFSRRRGRVSPLLSRPKSRGVSRRHHSLAMASTRGV